MLDKLSSSETAKPKAEARSRPSLAVLIVGMHRSGTSALGGVLNLLGVPVPEDQHPADEHNQRGYFEPQRVIDFHEALLATLGSPSNDPLPLTYDWLNSPVGQAAAVELADILDEEFGANAMCLFKDPRMCRLMPVWTAALARADRKAVAVLPCRHPLEVAGSLHAKAGLSRPYAMFMWLQHVILGERFTRDITRCFTRYDALLEDWRAVAEKLQRELGFAWPRDMTRAGAEIDAFLSGELRHQQPFGEGSPAHDRLELLCARAWAALNRLQDAAYDAAAMDELDAVWAELEAAGNVFAPLVVSYQRSESGLARQVAEMHVSLSELFASLTDERRNRDDIVRVLDEKQSTLILQTEQQEATSRELREALRQATRNERDLQRSRRDAEHFRARLQAIESSGFWALTYPLRVLLERLPGLRLAGRGAIKLAWWTITLQLGRRLRARRAFLENRSITGPVETTTAEPSLPVVERAMSGRVVFASGESGTPGHRYRVVRWAEAAQAAGVFTTIVPIEKIEQHLEAVRQADMVFIWRTPWDRGVEALLDTAKAAGVPVVFDTDDLMFDPELADESIIDGIRSQGLAETDVAEFYLRVQGVLARADFCTAPTPLLAQRMRRFSKPSFVLPNGFDEDVLQRSRLAARRRRREPSDGLIRIGYATGSRTHQRDFAQCAEGLAGVLRAYPHARLVLFIDGQTPILALDEFPCFEDMESQIEWRELVPLERLPDELARFDISIAPLEVGNPFCEAKSELKFFEAALVDVPTVASPTEPFRLAIRPGVSGILASDQTEWRAALSRLIDDPALRASMARSALYDALADYGPERRTELFLSLMEQVLASPRRVGRAFELELARRARSSRQPPHVPPHEVIFESDKLRSADVTVVIPLYNYAGFVEEALDSVKGQTAGDLDLIVVDDASTDESQAVALAWLKTNASRFNRALLIRNTPNAGLGFARNVGFANADTPFVLPLDADNRLRPHFVQQAVAAIRRASSAFAYPHIRQFGDDTAEMGLQGWSPGRFILGNYIDAMAMIRRSAWAQVGGYDHVRYGWEDYDFWCRLVEQGMFGVQIPEVLAEYRVHKGSMLRSETNLFRNNIRLIEDMERRHPWLRIERPQRPPGAEPPPRPPNPSDDRAERLARLLPLLRCPVTYEPLERDGDDLVSTGSGKVWPLVQGRPVLIDGMAAPRLHAEDMVSHTLPHQAVQMIQQTDGMVLNLSGGGTDRRFDNVVEAEFSVFRHTDVVADAHALPFADGVFELVISMNAFEHYHSPNKAVDEIMRVLKPGGQVYVHTAFMQPLHEAPWHFYNATRYGVERWFDRFETVTLGVSDNFNPVFPLTWQISDIEAALRRELSGDDADRLMDAKARELVTLWRDPDARQGALWESFLALPKAAQEGLAGGFEYLGRKPR